MKTKTSAALFWCGLIISAIGFVISQSNRIDPILKLISPKYANAISGEALLLQSGKLNPADKGFDEITHIFFDSRANHSQDWFNTKGIKILDFQCDPTSVAVLTDKSGAFVSTKILVHLSDFRTPVWDDRDLNRGVEQLKDKYILLFATLIFILGFIVQIVSRVFTHNTEIKTISQCKTG